MMRAMLETAVSRSEKCRMIAEKVMGWDWIRRFDDGRWHGSRPDSSRERLVVVPIPDYFTDPAAMVEVMEKLPTFERMARGDDGNTQVWLCVANQIAYVGYTPMEAVAEAAYQWSVASVTPPADASSSSAP